jgi:3-hydroxybutyryl-CoA dehydrogenase
VIERVAVVGAGTMGAGIAQAVAVAGATVRLTDVDADAVSRALTRIRTTLADGVSRNKISPDAADAALARIVSAPTLEAAAESADLLIEAVAEDLDVKRNVFARADGVTAPTVILATNTSSLSVSRIAQATHNPARVVGLHFFNPVHIMELVEVVVHDGIDPAIVPRLQDFIEALKKTAIVVHDSPGFASSRLGVALGLEAMRMVEEGVASVADIDTAMTRGYGHPMGPLRVSDLIGLDVRLKIADHLHRELGAPHFNPPEILRQKVRDGDLGRKTGRGFYDWTKP